MRDILFDLDYQRDRSAYPWFKLECEGDRLFLRSEIGLFDPDVKKIQNAASRWAKRHKVKLSTYKRKTGEFKSDIDGSVGEFYEVIVERMS